MTGDDDKTGGGREGLVRLLKVVGICLFFLALFATSLAPPSRALALLTLAAIFSGAVVYELGARGFTPLGLLAGVGAVFALAGVSWVALQRFDPAMAVPTGALVAAADAAPSTACDGRKRAAGDLLMVYGSDGVIGAGNGRFSPVRVGTCPALSFERKDGGLMVNGFGFDSDGNVVWRIENNEFSLVLRGFLKGVRPDPSTVRVIDEKKRAAMEIRFLNPGTVSVRGTFRCGDMDAVTFDGTRVRIGGRTAPPRCAVIGAGAPGLTYARTP